MWRSADNGKLYRQWKHADRYDQSYVINPFTSVAAITAWQFWSYLSNKSNFQKIFEGELFFNTLSATLLQIFWEFMLHSKVIFESMTGPDDTGQVDLQALMG